MKLIIKGILLYSTILLAIIIICSIDSLIETPIIAILIIEEIGLVILCNRVISYKELYKLTIFK